MGIIMPMIWGQDGSFPTPGDSAFDPHTYISGVAYQRMTPDRSMIVWRVPIANGIRSKANFQWYTCSGYQSQFPLISAACDPNLSSSWTTSLASATPVFSTDIVISSSRHSTGIYPIECSGVRYSVAHDSYTMQCLGSPDDTGAQAVLYWAPHMTGPWYPAQMIPNDPATGKDGGFTNFMGYGAVVNSTTPPSTTFYSASGGCCFNSPPRPVGGMPFYWRFNAGIGVVPPNGIARRYNSMGFAYHNIGNRFTSTKMDGAIPRRGIALGGGKYQLNWWSDLWDFGGYTRTTARPWFGEQLGQTGFFSACYQDPGPSLTCAFSHGFDMDSAGPSLGGTGYNQALRGSFADPTFAGDVDWTLYGTFKATALGGLFFAGNNSGATPVMVGIHASYHNAGDLCVVFGANSGATDYCTAGGVLTTGTWYFIAVTARARQSGTFPGLAIYVGNLGVLTKYTGSSLTKTCGTQCSATVNIASSGDVIMQDGSNATLSAAYTQGVYGDWGAASGAADDATVTATWKALQYTWKRIGRGQLWANAITVVPMPGQLVLAYDAPSTSACQVKISTDSAQTNLANDVNTSLFSGSDQDNRAGTYSNGVHRLGVYGKMAYETTGGGSVVSRALQNYSTYYVSVCGGPVQQVSTLNTFTGSTFGDLPSVVQPTLSTSSRSQTIVDAQTGYLMKPVSLLDDKTNTSTTAGAYMNDSGYTRMCTDTLFSDTLGHMGFLCGFPNDSVNIQNNLLYYIIQSTGEVHFLGYFAKGNQFNAQDGNIYYQKISDGDYSIYKCVPTDLTYSDQLQNHSFGCTESQLFSGQTPLALTLAYDSSFNGWGGNQKGKVTVVNTSNTSPTATLTATSGITFSSTIVGRAAVIAGDYYEVASYTDSSHIVVNTKADCCGGTNPHGGTNVDYWEKQGEVQNFVNGYAIVQFPVKSQDSYGSISIINLNTGLAVAATGFADSSVGNGSWCGVHNFKIMTDGYPNIASLEGHGLNGSDPWGTGPYTTTLTSNVSSGTTTIQVGSTTPTSSNVQSTIRAFMVNDWVQIGTGSGGGGEISRITAIPDTTHLTISRTSTNSYLSGVAVGAACVAPVGISYWKFLSDPHGTDTTGTNWAFADAFMEGGHNDWWANGRLTETYQANVGAIGSNLAGGATYFGTSQSPAFASVRGWAYGNAFQLHPSIHQSTALAPSSEMTWATDLSSPQTGGTDVNPNMTIDTGQRWKVNVSVGTGWNRKVAPNFFVNGMKSMTDVSGPSSTLGSTGADQGKYCVAVNANECVSGSSAGDVFANLPPGNLGTCDFPNHNDVCFGVVPGHSQSAFQWGAFLGTPTAHDRILSYNFAQYRNTFYYATAKSLPDASWTMTTVQTPTCPTGATPPCSTSGVWLIKNTPYVWDGQDRTTLMPGTINITTPGSLSIATAVVEFGYAEYGSASSHYCGSRAEACWATASTINTTTPLYYPSENPTKASCASSCTITIPVLPFHVAYYTVKFYNGSGTFVQNGDQGVCAETTCTKLP
jgi:hypothetical protein